MPHLLVFGSINMDLVISTPALPRPGQTVVGGNLATIPGGKGANQAVACARLGARTSMAGRVGADAFGSQLREHLAGAGVDVGGVGTDATAPTGVALIMVEPSGQNSIVVAPGANHALTPEHAGGLAGTIASADALLVQLEVPLAALGRAVTLAREAGVRVVMDAGPATRLPADLVALTDVISPNETETEALTGITPDTPARAEQAAGLLLAQGARLVVLKLGERGCLVQSPGEPARHLPAVPIRPVDTTAAGDAFTAALAVALCEGADPVTAARFANHAGALAATAFGAQPSMPTRSALEQFVQARSKA